MWRSILALILLPSLTAAQADIPATKSGAVNAEAAKGIPPKGPAYHPYTFYDRIRQGTTEDVAVELNASGFAVSPRGPVPGVIPVKLELNPAEGLTATNFRYPKPYERKLESQSKPLPVSSAWAFPIRFKLRANRNAALGSHILTGKLTFQTIDNRTGISAPQQVDLLIPVVVVEHGASVKKSQWPFTHLPVGLIVLLVVLSPVLVVIALPLMAICAITTGDPGCE